MARPLKGRVGTASLPQAAPRQAIHHARHCREGALTQLIKISPAAIEACFL